MCLRAVVALGKVRTDLPWGLRFRRRTLVGIALLFRPLQFSPPASGIELPHPGRSLSKPSTEKQNKVSRRASVFAFTAHGLARELHQNNARKRKALQYSQRAFHQPIASEPARRFGPGHAPGATPMRSPSLAESAAVGDPGSQPRQSSLERPKTCPTIGVHLMPHTRREASEQTSGPFLAPSGSTPAIPHRVGLGSSQRVGFDPSTCAVPSLSLAFELVRFY